MLNYLTNRYEEKRQAYDLLRSYDPWGKPGCGAPNPVSIRRHNLLVEGIFPEIKFKRSQFPESAILEKRRNRSAIRTRHRDSTLYYHPNGKTIVDNILRWKTPMEEQMQYRKCLDDIINYKKKMEDEELKKKIEYEKKMGWTTETSFNFPPIKTYSPKGNRNGTNVNSRKNSNVEKLKAIENLPQRIHGAKSSNYIDTNNRDNSYHDQRGTISSKSYMNNKIGNNNCRTRGCNCDIPTKPYRLLSGEKRCGGTPNAQLLEMTGGIELVPLLRGRRKPRILSGNRKWRARDSEYLKVLTEQVRMQQNRRKEERKAEIVSEKAHIEGWHQKWMSVK